MDQLNHIVQQLHLGWMASAAVAFAVRHYGPELVAWIKGEGVDEALAKGLPVFKALLARAGATGAEIMALEGLVAAVAARTAQDLNKDVQGPPGASSGAQ